MGSNITLDEAKAALDSLPLGAEPGTDGLTYKFYAALWPQMGPLLVKFFNAATSEEAHFLQQQQSGQISYLFKGSAKRRDEPSSYRPITLLNCDVKVLAKVLELRVGRCATA